MNPEWSECLRNDSAEIDAGLVTGFSSPAAATDDGMLAALTEMGVLRVSGDDAATFLQAHFCNDVDVVTDTTVQISGYCSPKGRLLAVFYLLRRGTDLLLIMPRELIESVHKRLSMFAQMARPTGKQVIAKVTRTAVQLSDVSDELVVTGLALSGNEDSINKINSLGVPLPATPATALTENGVSTLVLPGSKSLFFCVAEVARSCELWHALQPALQRVPSKTWLLQEIRAGLPRIQLVTQDSFVPQMANLHLLQGVSFTKGCYPGQEIVARMQYLGTLKRRMERFRLSGPLNGAEAGTAIVSGGDAAAGVVVSIAKTEEPDQYELLAVIKISRLGEGNLRLQSDSGAELELLGMPYATHEAELPAE